MSVPTRPLEAAAASHYPMGSVLVWGPDSSGSTLGAKLQHSGAASVVFTRKDGPDSRTIPSKNTHNNLRGQWPVIVFSNEAGDTRAEAEALEQYLAPGGYVRHFTRHFFVRVSCINSNSCRGAASASLSHFKTTESLR